MKTKCPLPKGFSGTRRIFGILVGLVALSMTAAPAAIGAPFAYISNSGSNSVSVIDGAKVGIPGATAVTNVTADSSMPFNTPWGVAVNATSTRTYVTNYYGSSVSVIDTATNRVVARVPVGYLPIGIALNAAGTRAYTANSGDGSVSVIDTATQSVVATIPSVGDFPYGIAVNPAGTYVYVTDWAFFSSGTGLVKIIDASSNTLSSRTVRVGNSPTGIGVSPSGGRVYVANTGSGTVSVIDTATNSVPSGGTLMVGTSPTGIAVSPSGLVAYVATQGGGVSSPGGVSSIWTPTNTILANVAIANSPFGVATDPAGARFFVGNQDGTVSVVDASTNLPVGAPVTVGNTPLVLGAFVGGTPSAPPCDDQLASLRQQLDAANATIASLQDQVTRLGNQITQLGNQITQLRADKAALQTQLDGALSRLMAANDTIASLNSTITNLGNQVTQLRADKAALQAQLTSLQNEYAQLTSDLAAANTTIAAQNQKLTSFVNHLFGAKVDVYVATAARDASYQALSHAVTKLGVASPRVREAQREYRDGLNDLAAGHYQGAVVHFRHAYTMVERSLSH